MKVYKLNTLEEYNALINTINDEVEFIGETWQNEPIIHENKFCVLWDIRLLNIISENQTIQIQLEQNDI
jgi:hypothetical protein